MLACLVSGPNNKEHGVRAAAPVDISPLIQVQTSEETYELTGDDDRVV